MKNRCPYLFVILIFVSSCKEQTIPAYLSIPSISVDARSYEGSSSSNISDVWVYQNLNLQGEYEMPVEFPILAEGNTQLLVFAGIQLDGISTTRAIYPFYDPDTINVTFTPTMSQTVYPVVRYSSIAEFDLIEGFEGGSNFTHMQRITGSDVFEGAFSGKLIVDSVGVVAETNSTFVIPSGRLAVFLEMDYKNNHLFQVGIIATYGTQTFHVDPPLNVTPKEEWNKLYINFTQEVNTTQADSYKIYFKMAPTTDPNSIHIFFDNLKLIHAKG